MSLVRPAKGSKVRVTAVFEGTVGESGANGWVEITNEDESYWYRPGKTGSGYTQTAEIVSLPEPEEPPPGSVISVTFAAGHQGVFWRTKIAKHWLMAGAATRFSWPALAGDLKLAQSWKVLS